MAATNNIIYNSNNFIDPETLIKKSEIKNHRKFDEINKHENDAIIEIDSDSDTENSINSSESECEEIINKPDLTLEVLKEVPHDDKENIQSTSSFNEFGKRPRGRPKENKPKSTKNEPSTAPKTFNISLGFLSCKSKTSRDKSKKAQIQNSKIQFDKIHNNKLKNIKKHGKRNQNKTKNVLIPNKSETIIKSESDNEIMPSSLNNSQNSSTIQETLETNTTNENLNNNFMLPVKRKRGRPFGTFKVKTQLNKKIPGQKGRPLSNGIIEIPPKKRRGRPFLNKLLIKKEKYNKPGRPSLGLKKIKKYDKPGRPPGPPKPIKIPGRRGRKPNPDSPPKKLKIPGRGRGRPSFASLKEYNIKKKEMSDESDIIDEKNNSINMTTDDESDNNSKESDNDNSKESDQNIFEESDQNIFEESDQNISEESDRNEIIVKNDKLIQNTSNIIQDNVINNLPILSEKIHIKNNENDIETISLASTDSNLEYNNKEILNIDNSEDDDDDDNDGVSENGYYAITDSNKFAKVEVQLDYMFHEKKAILQNHYI